MFGGITPVSGAVKQWRSQNLWAGKDGYSLTQNFQDILQLRAFDAEILAALGVCVCFLMVWWLARRSRSRDDWLLLVFLVGVFGLAAGHLAKFAQTVLTVHPVYGGHIWYFVPAYLMLALLVPAGCFVAIHLARRFVAPRSRRAATILSTGIVVIAAIILFIKTDFAGPFQYVDWHSDDTSFQEWEISSYSGILTANRILPEGSVLGSWSSGVIGYFARFPVVNLDGLVNSYDYLQQSMRGEANKTDKLFYQDEFGLTHFANANENSDNLFAGSTLFELPSFNNWDLSYEFRLAALAPPPDTDAAARFWEQMEPHFDYQSGDIGLLVDGRLAQAFHRNCRPDEVVAFSWESPSGAQIRAGTRGFWHPWPETLAGSRPFCAARIILPHDTAPPVRIESLTTAHYLARITGNNPPIIRSNYDVYLHENTLIYRKEQCRQDDLEAMFFLHLDPVDVNDLPRHRKQRGFDNLDFDIARHGRQSGATCFAIRILPQYDIAAIRTGQYVPGGGRVWQGEYIVAE